MQGKAASSTPAAAPTRRPPPPSRPYCTLDEFWKVLKSGDEAAFRKLHFPESYVNSTDQGSLTVWQRMKGEKGLTPLHWAAGHGPVGLVHTLIGMKADIETKVYSSHLTPLGYVVLMRRSDDKNVTEVVKALVAAGANINAASYIYWASSNNDIVRIFLNAKANFDAHYFTPPLLVRAAGENQVDIVRLLLDAKVTPNAKASSWRGETSALTSAYRAGHVDVARMLLQANANPDVVDSDGKTPLHLAKASSAKEKNDEIIQFLTDAKLSADLRQAVKQKDIGAVTSLLAAKADPDVADGDGNTSLHLASTLPIKEGGTEIVRLLTDAKANTETKNKKGETPLQLATKSGTFTDTAQLLLDRKAKLEVKDGQVLLAQAVKQNNVGAVRSVLTAKADPNAAKVTRALRSSFGLDFEASEPALEFAWKEGHSDIVRMLVAAKADIEEIKDADGNSLLAQAIRDNKADTVQLLLDVKANPNTEIKKKRYSYGEDNNDYLGPALGLACKEGQVNVARMLVGTKADVDAVDGNSNAPLHYAAKLSAKAGGAEIVRLLTDAKANTETKNKNGETPLQLAVQTEKHTKTHMDIAQLLLTRKASADVKDKNGNTLLAQAVNHNNAGVVQLLLDAKANPDVEIDVEAAILTFGLTLEEWRKFGGTKASYYERCYKASYKGPSLGFACKEGHIDVARMLIDANAATDAKNKNGHTALVLARTALFNHNAQIQRRVGLGEAVGPSALEHKRELEELVKTLENVKEYRQKKQEEDRQRKITEQQQAATTSPTMVVMPSSAPASSSGGAGPHPTNVDKSPLTASAALPLMSGEDERDDKHFPRDISARLMQPVGTTAETTMPAVSDEDRRAFAKSDQLRLAKLEEELQAAQTEIKRLRAQPQPSAADQQRIVQLEQDTQPLKEERRLRLQDQAERKYVETTAPLKYFHRRLQGKVNQLFTAYMGVSSGKISYSDKGNKTIDVIGTILSVPTAGISSIVGKGSGMFYGRYQKRNLDRTVSSWAVRLMETEELVEHVARRLALDHEAKIQTLTAPVDSESWTDHMRIRHGASGGAETLADCAAARIAEALRDEGEHKITPDHPTLSLEEQLLNSVYSRTGTSNSAIEVQGTKTSLCANDIFRRPVANTATATTTTNSATTAGTAALTTAAGTIAILPSAAGAVATAATIVAAMPSTAPQPLQRSAEVLAKELDVERQRREQLEKELAELKREREQEKAELADLKRIVKALAHERGVSVGGAGQDQLYATRGPEARRKSDDDLHQAVRATREHVSAVGTVVNEHAGRLQEHETQLNQLASGVARLTQR
jgi:ankyrin repeat protein